MGIVVNVDIGSRPVGPAERARSASWFDSGGCVRRGRLAGRPLGAARRCVRRGRLAGASARRLAAPGPCCFSMNASSWPISVLAGELTSASASRAGPSRSVSTWPISTSRLGSLVMSSTCSGPTTTPSTAPPLITGFLSVLTCCEISLASSAIPSPPHAAAEGPSRNRDSPSIPRSAKTRRASEFFSTLSRIDFFRKSRRS